MPWHSYTTLDAGAHHAVVAANGVKPTLVNEAGTHEVIDDMFS